MRVLVTVSIKCDNSIQDLLHEIVGATRVNRSALENSHISRRTKKYASDLLLELAFFLVSERALAFRSTFHDRKASRIKNIFTSSERRAARCETFMYAY